MYQNVLWVIDGILFFFISLTVLAAIREAKLTFGL